MLKIGNVDGWAGMFFLTKFAENLIPSLLPVHWSRAHNT